MDKNSRVISDAPESNAGDDFHVLWSIRKSLELLNTDDYALKAITVEGVFPNEAKKLDPTGFLFWVWILQNIMAVKTFKMQTM
ncbi:MAG: hypothetical protein CVU11_02790 [Bacteroidetes bacterium HGW-Bacteroidetes-6]|jgi:hypothetical protein|nr:MAG: hypothetical protein CVU12_04525 [Bacteroidetes bacterium HGW-Bacteroidetes-7]PKP04851.1 MAG: hypothetical protein CVU11_02790 [Bacteroidetes bacterium HGW-Bacteroidetes-6]